MKVMVIGSKTICRKSYKSQKPVNGSVIYAVYLCNDVHGIACGSFWINSPFANQKRLFFINYTISKPHKIL